jgi:hypothetical protein
MSILSDELLIDPEAIGYSGMTDEQVVTAINLVNREVDKTLMTRQEILENIEPAALATLTGDNATKVLGILSDTVNPFGVAAQVFIDAFGAGSQTIINLAAARKHTLSRAQELGIPKVKTYNVTEARA